MKFEIRQCFWRHVPCYALLFTASSLVPKVRWVWRGSSHRAAYRAAAEDVPLSVRQFAAILNMVGRDVRCWFHESFVLAS